MKRTESPVTSSAAPGVTLQVSEYGDRSAPVHVLLVHGFPDDQRMWEPVAAHLPAEWHVVTYDVRGSGRSSHPEGVRSYRLPVLVDDLVAVLDATVPAGRRVHLVGHDWGSVAGWDVLAAETRDSRLSGRLASYTSCSGPSLDHLASVASTWPGRVQLFPQALRSWYVWLFQLPGFPELAFRRLQARIRKDGARIDPTIELVQWGEDLTANTRQSINLYRANVLQRSRRPDPWRTSVPVQLVVPLRDGWVTPRAVAGMEARCRRLARVEVDEGHWLPRARPEEFAGIVESFVRSTD